MNTFITKEAFVSASDDCDDDDDVKYSSGDNVLSSSSTTTIDNRSPSSVVRQMFWNYPYSNNNNNTSMHFLGGSSIFPTTTTVSLHNNSNINKISGGPESRGTLLTTTGSSRLHQHRRYHAGGSSTSTTTRQDGQTTKMLSDPFIASTDCDPDCPSSWSESSLVISPYPRPTDQLLKLIRRRRGSVVNNSNNNNNNNNTSSSSNSSHPNHNDDSWNAVRYHIMNRPADCRYVCYKSNLSTPLHAACLYRAPHDVILMILTAWPAATLQQDAEGWNPLHIHILYNTVGSDMYYNTTMTSTTTNTTSHHHRYYRRPCTTTTTTTTTTTITATESLIRFGGAAAASQHSKFVGSVLHLACRHNVAASILAELLQVCPSQVYIPNEAGGLPANLQWKACYKDKTRLINTTNDNTTTTDNEITQLQSQQQQYYPDECHYDLFVKLNLFLAAFRNAPILLDQAIQCLQYPMFTVHDVIDFHYSCCSSQSDYVRLFVSFNPSSVFDANPERQWKLPLHTAASYSSTVPIHGKFYASNSNNNNNNTTSMAAVNTNQHQVSRNVGSDTLVMGSSRLMVVNSTNEMLNQQQQYMWLPITTTNVPLLSGVTYGSTRNGSGSILYANTNLTVPHSPMDPLETILRAYPEGVICKEIHTNRIPLHVALLVGKRTWHTGIASLVAVAPETVEWKDTVTNLFPFQLAAAVTDDPPGRQQQQPPKTTWSSGGTRIQEQRLKLQEEKEQLAQLETIYFLLLACPHLIIHPSSSSNQKAA